MFLFYVNSLVWSHYHNVNGQPEKTGDVVHSTTLSPKFGLSRWLPPFGKLFHCDRASCVILSAFWSTGCSIRSIIRFLVSWGVELPRRGGFLLECWQKVIDMIHLLKPHTNALGNTGAIWSFVGIFSLNSILYE